MQLDIQLVTFLLSSLRSGHGASSIVLAKAYPNSSFYGFDNHDKTIETAKLRAKEAGLSSNIHFETLAAKNFTEQDFALVCFMDCLHDMGGPGRAKTFKRSVKGCWL